MWLQQPSLTINKVDLDQFEILPEEDEIPDDDHGKCGGAIIKALWKYNGYFSEHDQSFNDKKDRDWCENQIRRAYEKAVSS